MKVKVKRTVLTGYLKPKESEEKRENSNAAPPPPPHHGVTGITGVTTRRLTGGEISSPSQPYHFPVQFNSNPNQTYLNKLIKVFRINRKLQAAEFLSRYELNSAGMWTSRTRAENLSHTKSQLCEKCQTPPFAHSNSSQTHCSSDSINSIILK